MKIILDGMGGDNAPGEIVKGAVMASELIDDEICIIGNEKLIIKELKKNKYDKTKISNCLDCRGASCRGRVWRRG
jgi:glycerol-3-phosphate acyltransferase PlsX